MMANQIIARGEVIVGFTECWLLDHERNEYFSVGGDWAAEYVGRTLVISLEEKEEEQELSHNLAVVLVGA